jgi:septal ring factor EnvC (AmiA/AmiB activator)
MEPRIIATVALVLVVIIISVTMLMLGRRRHLIDRLTNERDDTRAQRDRLNTENLDLHTANVKLAGQVKELQGLLASAEILNSKLQEKLDEASEAYAETIGEQLKKIGEKERTIRQQQQVQADLQKQLDPTARTIADLSSQVRSLQTDNAALQWQLDELRKPAPRKKGEAQ